MSKHYLRKENSETAERDWRQDAEKIEHESSLLSFGLLNCEKVLPFYLWQPIVVRVCVRRSVSLVAIHNQRIHTQTLLSTQIEMMKWQADFKWGSRSSTCDSIRRDCEISIGTQTKPFNFQKVPSNWVRILMQYSSDAKRSQWKALGKLDQHDKLMEWNGKWGRFRLGHRATRQKCCCIIHHPSTIYDSTNRPNREITFSHGLCAPMGED